jgi:hypothetical protein
MTVIPAAQAEKLVQRASAEKRVQRDPAVQLA